MLYQPELHDTIAFSDAFVLLKPDVFYRGLLDQILRFLKGHGLSVLRYLAGRVSDSQYKLMYANNFCWNVDDWHHNRKLYTFGPALGLILSNENCENTLGFLSHLKGSALPLNRKEGSLRKAFQSKSRIFNLIHVPDQHEQAAKEAVHWFGSSSAFQNNVPISLATVAEELQLARYCEGQRCQLDPEEVFIKTKIRLLHALKNKGNASAQLKDLICKASLFYHRWAIKVFEATDCNGIEGTILPEWQEEEKILLDEIIEACHDDHKRETTLKVLSNPSTCYKFPSNFFWILDEWDVYLSELEQYLVLSRLKYIL